MTLECKDKEGNTMLYWASKYGFNSFCNLLINNGADVNTRNNNGETPLFVAASNNLGDVQNSPSGREDNPYARKDSVILSLIRGNANVNIADFKKFTPLMNACINDRPFAVAILIKNGANVNIKDKLGNTALMYAVLNVHIIEIKLLLNNSANKLLKNKKGKTAVDIAKNKKNKKMIAILK